jgi:hypothetical protein
MINFVQNEGKKKLTKIGLSELFPFKVRWGGSNRLVSFEVDEICKAPKVKRK